MVRIIVDADIVDIREERESIIDVAKIIIDISLNYNLSEF